MRITPENIPPYRALTRLELDIMLALRNQKQINAYITQDINTFRGSANVVPTYSGATNNCFKRLLPYGFVAIDDSRATAITSRASVCQVRYYFLTELGQTVLKANLKSMGVECT